MRSSIQLFYFIKSIKDQIIFLFRYETKSNILVFWKLKIDQIIIFYSLINQISGLFFKIGIAECRELKHEHTTIEVNSLELSSLGGWGIQ
jgi:hypothetical protein